MNQKLIFVYNADSGIVQGAIDSLHKFISPESYPCALCELTHGYLGAKQQRNNWLKKQSIDLVFLHKDQKDGLTDTSNKLPCIVHEINGTQSCIITAEEMNTMQSLDELIAELDTKLLEHTTDQPPLNLFDQSKK